MYRRLRAHAGAWDMIVVGGGATGAGVAIDAASRGYDVLLLEQSDFGKGTSSRSTKLVHGGVRYLEQGNLSLVMEALKERGLLLQNAPHLVRNLGFVVPNYDWWEAPFYGVGLKLYNLLAGKYGFGSSRILSREETLERLPTIKTEGLKGGVIYFDGQFDDSRLLINLVATACEQGATLLNYAEVTQVTKDGDGFVDGVRFRDVETGAELEARAKVVINATGPFADNLRRTADPAVEPMIAPSQGIHLVFDGSFLAARQRHHGPAHQRRARHVCHPVARPYGGGHHGHADRALHAGTGGAGAGGGVHPADGVALSRQETGARRRAQRVRGNSSAGAFRRERQYRGAFARPHHPHRELRHDHDLRRQVDHLSSHGGGLRQSGGDAGAVGGKTVRHGPSEYPRLPSGVTEVRPSVGIRLGRADGAGAGGAANRNGPCRWMAHCLTPARKWCGPCVTNWRSPWRMFWRAARGRCSWTPGPHFAWRRGWRI